MNPTIYFASYNIRVRSV